MPLPSNGLILGNINFLGVKIIVVVLEISSSSVTNETKFNEFLFTHFFLDNDPTRLDFICVSLSTKKRAAMSHGDLLPRNLLVESEDNYRFTGVVD